MNTTQHRTLSTAIVAAAVTVAASGGAIGAGTPSSTAVDAVADDQLAAAIQDIIDASLVPGAIDWNCCGVDLPPTGVIVGVRVPGQADILLSAGSYLDDGTALDPMASFSTAGLGFSIVTEIGMKLVAEGTLDADATIDAWLPDHPNAERITVGMLIDGTAGWGADYGPILGQNVLADLERRWTTGEAVATLRDLAPDSEPGMFGPENFETGLFAVAYIVEQVTGDSLADLVASTITEPAGLDDSFLSDGTDLPDDYQHGRFFVEELPMHSTAEVPLTAYFTYAPVVDAFVSTVPDLLDLLDTWVDGTWRPGATPPTPAAFPTDRELDPEYVGDLPRYLGLDVPYNGYCPCQPTSDGNTVDYIGRRPATVGTDVNMFHYLDDDISIVLQYNSNTWVDRSPLEAILADIRATVAASS